MIKLKVYKTNIGLFVQVNKEGYPMSHVHSVRINDKDLERTHIDQWWSLPNETEVKTVHVKKPFEYINQRYELLDPSFASDRIPLVINKADIIEEFDDVQEETVWANYPNLQSLYKYAYDVGPDTWDEVEFEIEWEKQVTIDNPFNPSSMTVKLDNPNRNSIFCNDSNKEEIERKIENLATFNDLERMLTDPLFIHYRPCKLSSDIVYRIVRHHIKTNIDPKRAYLSSDYDFCMTVTKWVDVKPYTVKKEELTRTGRKHQRPKFKEVVVNRKSYAIFEATPAGKRWKEYPVMDALEGDNLQDLYNVLQNYLTELMDYINSPVKECEHCSGCGVIMNKEYLNGKPIKENK